MWSRKASLPAGHPVLGRIWHLQRLRRRPLGLLYAVEVLLAWLRNLLKPTGVAHVVSILCFLVQTIGLNLFLVRFVGENVLITVAVEVPLVLHVAWFWRQESAHRAAPVQWLVYSWMHAAKVAVLFCRVMPKLPSNLLEKVVTEDLFSSSGEDSLTVFGYVISPDIVENIFSAPVLASLLLVTPVFYALLMFRTSKAIFGSFSRRITVDRIMHFDMLWHVVIDMVDQVNMFYLSRVSEWGGPPAQDHQRQLVFLQGLTAFLLFLSIVLQAQALPGVFVDRWSIPEPPPLPAELVAQMEQAQAAQAAQDAGATASMGSSERPSASWLRLSTFSRVSGATSARLSGMSTTSAMLMEGRSSGLGLVDQAPPLVYGRPQKVAATPARFRSPSSASAPSSEAYVAPAEGDHEEPLEEPEPDAPRVAPSPLLDCLQSRSLAHSQRVGSVAGPYAASPPHMGSISVSPTLGMTSVGMGSAGLRSPTQMTLGSAGTMSLNRPTMTVDSQMTSRTSGTPSLRKSIISLHLRGGMEAFLKNEKERRDLLQDIINRIHRHSVITARKRSAVASIFFTDLPFLSVRLTMAFMLGSHYFPGLGVKNAICIVLNAMQWGVVSVASRESNLDIQRELAVYLARFHPGADGNAFAGGALDEVNSPLAAERSQSPSEQNLSAAGSPQRGAANSPPVEGRAPLMLSAAVATSKVKEGWRQGLPASTRKVREETVRTAGVCVHFWSLTLAFGVGLLLSKGEGYMKNLWGVMTTMFGLAE